ncbi:hypothetical protein ACHAXR_009406 [Thalassiosira sp. AJA248-18]
MSGGLVDHIFNIISGRQQHSLPVDGRPLAFQFSFRGFETLPVTQCLGNAEFSCFGHNHKFSMWCLPNNDDREYLTCFLQSATNNNDENVDMWCEAEIICSDGSHRRMTPLRVKGVFQFPYQEVIDPENSVLIDGALVFRVHLKESGTTPNPPPFIPTNPICEAMLNYFLDEKSADVVFEIEDDNNTREKIHAHRFILKPCAPTLAELCEGSGEGVPITNVKPNVFRILLYYVYGGKVSDKLLSDHCIEILNAADRYNIANLKVEAEVWYVENTTITLENVVGNFYFADTKKCPLLKEKVMDFILDNRREFLHNCSTLDLPHSQYMLSDILAALAKRENEEKPSAGDNPSKFTTMPINNLRRRLHSIGLGVDGTREMLVAALEENMRNKMKGGGP